VLKDPINMCSPWDVRTICTVWTPRSKVLKSAVITHNRLVAGSNPAGPTYYLMKPSGFVEISLILLITLGCMPAPTEATPRPSPAPINFTNTTVSLTFDDGAADNYAVRPILSERGLHATFYIVSGFTGTEGYMTAGQLRDLFEDGNEIGGHTLNHTKLTEVRGADLEREICQDRQNLLDHGFEVTSFAYPFGHYDEVSKQVVKDCGYANARAVTGGPDAIPPEDPFALQAMPYIVQDTTINKLMRYVTGAEVEGGGWVILVFHRVCTGYNEYAIDLETFTNLADWLAYQRDLNGLVIKTVGEVIGR